jgi:hypothetical protein
MVKMLLLLGLLFDSIRLDSMMFALGGFWHVLHVALLLPCLLAAVSCGRLSMARSQSKESPIVKFEFKKRLDNRYEFS